MIRGMARNGPVRIWLAAAMALLLTSVIPVLNTAAQVSTPTAEEGQFYVDPEDRFAVPIPTNWTAEEHDGYATIATDDGKIVVSVAIVQASGATPGIDLLMRQLDPEFESDALAELLATPETVGDDSAFYTFDDGVESGELLEALGRKIGEDSVFVLVLQGELEAVKLRQVQINKILDGILIRAESGATPVASPAA